MDGIYFLIDYLKKYNHVKGTIELNEYDTLRALMNITMPHDLSEEYYAIQDEVLKEYYSRKKIINGNELIPFSGKICLYRGDITLLKTDAITNACNEKMLGCFRPLHQCIDNAIHSYAGLQVRRDMMKIMEAQGHDEENGGCKVTKGYNLPSSYIFHTVGPQVYGRVTKKNDEDLKNCYLSCLKKAEEMKLESLAFCSISTGVYGYPFTDACRLAIKTVNDYLKKETSIKRVIFDVFSEADYETYERELKKLN